MSAAASDMTPDALALELYAAVLDDGSPEKPLENLTRLLGGEQQITYTVGFDGCGVIYGDELASLNVDRGMIPEYQAHWWQLDVRMRQIVQHRPGVLNLARVLPPPDYARTPIWNEFTRKRVGSFHCLTAKIEVPGDIASCFSAYRSRDREPFGPREEALLQGIYPHLRRALAARARLFAGAGQGTAATAGLDALRQGVAVLSEEGRLLFSNAALRDMAAQADGFVLDRNGLYCPVARARRALRHAITAALAAARGQLRFLHENGSLAISRPSEAAPWIVQVLPLRRGEHGALAGFSGAMLLVSDAGNRATPSPALLRHLLDLTPAEAALAVALTRGETLASYATARRLSVETARTHLASIRRKTGCRRQADLVALISRVAV
ncbi:helix-turn-helix transcriptional regulator [Roseomonas sp. BN140053]|uniref:helix-turn-helix transcriptional regulator n=1 Tax=Roseomonas sp. BN140053 TaxID=3391898 RepID=UPI0039E9A9C1